MTYIIIQSESIPRLMEIRDEMRELKKTRALTISEGLLLIYLEAFGDKPSKKECAETEGKRDLNDGN